MPIKKICNKAACHVLIDHNQKYCDRHSDQETINKRERNRYYDKYKRDKEATEFYHSKEWLIVRQDALIRDNYLCMDCYDDKVLTSADVVDHIRPREHFPELALDINNLRSLCHKHHNRKTADDKKKYAHN